MDELRRRPCSASTPPTLRLGEPDTETVPNVTTTRATQALGAVPVLDASLVFTGRGSPASTDDQRVTGVRGRVFPGLTVDTTPTITARAGDDHRRARRPVGRPTAAARLVVLPTGTGRARLGGRGRRRRHRRTCRPAATTSTPHTGDLVDVRPVSAEVLPPVPDLGQSAAAPDPNSVTVTGTDPLGRDLTAFGLQNGDGVELTDTTTDGVGRRAAHRRGPDLRRLDGSRTSPSCPASWSPARARRSATRRRSPRRPTATGSSTTTSPSAATPGTTRAGRWSARSTSGPRASATPSSRATCASRRWSTATRASCRASSSAAPSSSPTSRRTRSPTASPRPRAGLLYTGQSGALNESFSDYFGNVIGNLIHGNDSVAMGEDACAGSPAEPAVRARTRTAPRRSATCSTAATSTTTCGSSRPASG